MSAAPRVLATAAPAASPTTVPTAGPAGFAPVSFTIALPKAAASARRAKPLYVPASTTAISVSVNGTTAQTFPCAGTSCSGSFQAPAGGTDSFLFNAVDTQNNVLATTTVTQSIAANGINTISVSLEGVIARTTLAITPPGLPSYVSGTATVTATAYDADNDVITGTYAAPITLSTNDTTGTVAVVSGTLPNDTSTGTIGYTFSNATLYTDNHVSINAFSATETMAAHGQAFIVGRTYYTFTPTAVVGFAPGATTPTRTIAISPAFSRVASIACDGTNVYILDDPTANLYGIAPTDTTPSMTYFNSYGPVWITGDVVPTNRAQLYAADIDAGDGTPAVVGYQGTLSAPPFPLATNVPVQSSSVNSAQSVVTDQTGNVYAALGVPEDGSGGYVVFNSFLNATAASGSNPNVESGPSQIAVDTTVSPPRIYTVEQSSINYLGEISEYDNFAATPTHISTDAILGGNLYVDPFGYVYTSAAGGIFHVYSPGTLQYGVSNVAYSLPGASLAFDSAGYVYATNASGSITVYPPQVTTPSETIPGTNYGQPTLAPNVVGTFCR